MSLHTADEIAAVLEDHHSFGECILEDVRWRDYGITLDLVFNYIWDNGDRVRDNLDQPLLKTVTFHGVREFHVRNELNEAMLLSPERINWGIGEIAVMRIADDPHFLARYGGLPVPTHHVVCQWESERRVDVVFTSMEVS